MSHQASGIATKKKELATEDCLFVFSKPSHQNVDCTEINTIIVCSVYQIVSSINLTVDRWQCYWVVICPWPVLTIESHWTLKLVCVVSEIQLYYFVLFSVMMTNLLKSLILNLLIAIFGIKLLLFYYDSHGHDETAASPLPYNYETSPSKYALDRKGVPYLNWLPRRLDQNKPGKVKMVSYMYVPNCTFLRTVGTVEKCV